MMRWNLEINASARELDAFVPRMFHASDQVRLPNNNNNNNKNKSRLCFVMAHILTCFFSWQETKAPDAPQPAATTTISEQIGKFRSSAIAPMQALLGQLPQLKVVYLCVSGVTTARLTSFLFLSSLLAALRTPQERHEHHVALPKEAGRHESWQQIREFARPTSEWLVFKASVTQP